MNPTDTQQVTAHTEAERDALASIFTPSARQPRPEVIESASTQDVFDAKTPAETVKAEQAAAAQPSAPAPQEPKAQEPAQVATAEAVEAPAPTSDPTMDAILDAYSGTTAPTPSWTPEAVAAFKATFGVEDPSAYKADFEKRIQEADLLRQEYEAVKPLAETINSLPPAVLEPLTLIMQGKVKEAKAYMASTPGVVLANKTAEQCSDRELIDAYLPGKVSADKWDMLEDPEADADVKDALTEKVKILREAAEEKHSRTLENIKSKQEAEKTAREQAAVNYRANVAATLTTLNSTPLKSLATKDFTEAISSGQYISRYVNQDGSPTPEAATLHLKALNFDKAVEAAYARGLKQGQQGGLLESTSRQPSVPATQRRTSGDPVVDQTEADALRAMTFRALTAK